MVAGNLEMTKIKHITVDRAALWNLFVGTKKGKRQQTIVGNFHPKGDYIEFKVYYPGDAKTNTSETTLRHAVKKSDIKNIEATFFDVSWSSVPFADYLLWILWIREEIFDMRSPLKEGDKSNFTKGALALSNMKVNDETVKKAFDTLLRKKYLEEGGKDWKMYGKVYFLTQKGKRIAEIMFIKNENGTFAHNESVSIAPKKENEAKFEPGTTKTLIAALRKGERIDLNKIIRAY